MNDPLACYFISFSTQQRHTRMRLKKNPIIPFFGPILPVHTGTGRDDCVAFHFSYHFFIVPLFGTERFRSPVKGAMVRMPFNEERKSDISSEECLNGPAICLF